MFENTTDDCSSKSWIDFNETSLELTYNVTDTVDAITYMTLKGKDPYNEPTNMAIVISVDFKPRLNASITNLTGRFIVQELSYFEIDGSLFSDEDMSTLQYTLTYTNGSAIESWLIFTPPSSPPSGVFNISGIYPFHQENEYAMTITANDANNLNATANITLIMQTNCHASCKE